MARGMKMTTALYADKLVCAGDVNDSYKGSLICRYCSASVVHVNEYNKEASRRSVLAHFRLGRNQEHDSQCCYKIENYIQNLFLSQSEALDNNNKILTKNRNGVFCFRLNFIDKSNTERYLHKDTYGRIRSADESDTKGGVSYTNRDQKISCYFRTAMGVARIWALTDVSELRDLITIKYKSYDIRWSDFVFDESRYFSIYKQNHKRLSYPERYGYPVAILVTPKEVFKQKRNSRYCIRCCKDVGGTNCITPYLDLLNPELKSIALKKRYIVLGYPTIWAPQRRIYVEISRKNQIESINEK